MLNDIEIAQQAEMKNIKEVAAKLDIKEDDIEMYGKYKAKLSDELIASVQKNENGKLILVTAINPTPAGEGKTTITHMVYHDETMSLHYKQYAFRSRRQSHQSLRF